MFIPRKTTFCKTEFPSAIFVFYASEQNNWNFKLLYLNRNDLQIGTRIPALRKYVLL